MKNERLKLILILGLLSAIGPFSIDMYLPAFPAIAEGLDTTVSKVVMSLSSFFIGISAGQLLYGPLLERFGRKKPLYVGLTVYLVATIGCTFTLSVESLILFRFLQALGSCAGMVTSRAIVRDLFDVKDNARIFSALMLVIAVSPIIAPTLGGYLTAVFGWRSVFIALAIIAALILVLVITRLPESKGDNPNHSLMPRAVITGFYSILIQPSFYVFALTGAMTASGIYAYISGSSPVFMQIYGVSEKTYGWIFAFIAMGLIGSSQLNNLALRKVDSATIVMRALMIQTVVCLIFVTTSAVGIANLWSTMMLSFAYVSCQGFIFPNASALTMANFGHSAGNASALMGAIQMGIGAFASAMVGILENGTVLPMPAVMGVCTVMALIIFSLGRKMATAPTPTKAVEEEELEMIQRL